MKFVSTAASTDAAYFGALPSQDGVRFLVWADAARSLSLVIRTGRAAGIHPLARLGDGVFETWVKGAAPGDLYVYRLDDEHELPDPASRYQPEGVHGPSQVVDPAAFRWSDEGWRIRQLQDLIVYELHVGTFSPEGTFAGVEARLPYLRDLGITAIELMPVADFAGQRNWGYDGVALFAPARVYGTPDDLRRLVDRAHAAGLAVLLDVVYNHLGPEGAYLPRFSHRYLSSDAGTPWGGAINVDGPGSRQVRHFLIDNAVHWIREYHLDGLRLDATHALTDASRPHIVQEIVEHVRRAAGRDVIVHAEDHRNLAAMIRPVSEKGWGLDGVWADDFHHVLRRMVTGDAYGYFRDFNGSSDELASVIRQGWLYTGQYSQHQRQARGSDASEVPMYRFVVCLQNHDQVGNRALGDRLHQTIAPAVWRALSTVLLTCPMTPLLFMGQEWATASPFLYFTDLEAGLGRHVTEGRRREFAEFPDFSQPGASDRIPDPQAASTFERSRLDWGARTEGEHQRSLALYQALIALRRDERDLWGDTQTTGSAVAIEDGIVIRRGREQIFWAVACFSGSITVDLAAAAASLDVDLRTVTLETVLDTEHGEFAADPLPIDVATFGSDRTVRFQRPGAVVLRER